VAHQIEEGDLESQAQVESRDEIGTFARTFNRMTTQLRQTMQQIRREKKRADDLLDVVIPIGVALSSERNFNQLLENMLAEAMAFCNADGGAILLRDDKLLRLMMLRITSREAFFGGTSGQPITLAPLDLYDGETGAPDERYPATYVVAHNTPVNIADSRDSQLPFETPRIAAATADLDYEPVSLLALPLKNTQNEVLGVLQLFNAQDPATGQIVPFDANLQQMMASFSSLAVAALESYIREQSLRQEIQQLRIQVDENKQQEQVSEIVETDFFQDLQARARTMRRRNQGAAPPADNHAAEDTTQ
jgi:transcriptional regulator with GAF, ATPase, and Fis domain